MALELAAARAVAQAKLLERALHDPGPWEIQVNDVRMLAVKVKTPNRVIFLAYFPPMCWVDPPEVAWLVCRGEEMACRQIVAPGEGAHEIEWSLGLDEGLVNA